VTRLAHWCFAHRKRVVAGWLVAIVLFLGLSQAVGSSFNSNLSPPISRHKIQTYFRVPGTNNAPEGAVRAPCTRVDRRGLEHASFPGHDHEGTLAHVNEAVPSVNEAVPSVLAWFDGLPRAE
jgi:hypothetical protein